MNPISIRNKVARAIKNAPTYVDIYRISKVWSEVDDAYIESEPTKLFTAEGLLDNSSHSALSITLKEGGKLERTNTPKFFSAYVKGQDFKQGDYFIYRDKKYTVTNAVNILELDIYWELDLEMEVIPE